MKALTIYHKLRPLFALLPLLLCGILLLPARQIFAQTPITQIENTAGDTVLVSFDDGGLLGLGVFGTGTNPVSGAGTRMMWYPAKAAFRAGRVYMNEWDNTNIGDYSAAFGSGVTASGDYSFATGFSDATAIGASALGNSKATQRYASSFGTGKANGEYATAFGFGSIASGDYSVAGGEVTEATARSATAFGLSTKALGYSSIAMGENAEATYSRSAAIGWGTKASNSGAVAIGNGAIASGQDAIALGNQAWADGGESIAIGTLVKTEGIGGFAFGDRDFTADTLRAGQFEFAVRASGGINFYTSPDLSSGVTLGMGSGSWSTLSDSTKKEHFRSIDGETVLTQIAQMPVPSWNYKTQPDSIRHMGPMAQDFYTAFGLGSSNKRISTVDIDGVNMRAIQALETRTRMLQQKNEALETRVAKLEQQNQQTASLPWSATVALLTLLIGGGIALKNKPSSKG